MSQSEATRIVQLMERHTEDVVRHKEAITRSIYHLAKIFLEIEHQAHQALGPAPKRSRNMPRYRNNGQSRSRTLGAECREPLPAIPEMARE